MPQYLSQLFKLALILTVRLRMINLADPSPSQMMALLWRLVPMLMMAMVQALVTFVFMKTIQALGLRLVLILMVKRRVISLVIVSVSLVMAQLSRLVRDTMMVMVQALVTFVFMKTIRALGPRLVLILMVKLRVIIVEQQSLSQVMALS